MYKIDTKPKKTEAEDAVFNCTIGMLALLIVSGIAALIA